MIADLNPELYNKPFENSGYWEKTPEVGMNFHEYLFTVLGLDKCAMQAVMIYTVYILFFQVGFTHLLMLYLKYLLCI